jgi:putative ABC transport system ATP-binding protein
MIRLGGVRKVYARGRAEVVALERVDLEVARGEFVAVMGPSGSGKSTLLHLIGGLDRPTEGRIAVAGRALAEMSDDELTLFRRTQIGFVFQFFNLLPTLTAAENVMLPLLLAGRSRQESSRRALSLLERAGLAARAHHLPEELSGGEIQRVAVARSLVFAPPLLLADEPTGNLDSKSGEEILALLSELHRDEKCTVVLVTHNEQAARRAARVIHLKDGRIVGDSAWAA